MQVTTSRSLDDLNSQAAFDGGIKSESVGS